MPRTPDKVLDQSGRNDPACLLSEQELKRIVMRTLLMLPEDLRDVFVLRELEGYPYREIAEAKGWDIETVRSCLRSAKRQLRELLPSYVERDWL